MYLYKPELDFGIEKLIEIVDKDGIEICLEIRRELKLIEGTNIEEYVESKHSIIEVFLLGLEMKEQPPAFIVDYVYLFLANKFLTCEDVGRVMGVISNSNSWCDASKMRVLQMSYPLVKHEMFVGEAAFSLLKSVLGFVEDKDRQIRIMAVPTVMYMVDFIFSKTCECYHDIECIDDEKTGVCSDVNDITIDVGLSVNQKTDIMLRPSSTLRKEAFVSSSSLCFSFMQHLFSKAIVSKEIMCFTIEVLLIAAQKRQLFKCEEFRMLYFTYIADVLAKQILEENVPIVPVYNIISLLAEGQFCGAEESLVKIFDQIEKLCGFMNRKDLSRLLEFLSSTNPIYFSPHAVIVERIFFKIFEEISFEYGAVDDDAIMCIKKFLEGRIEKNGDEAHMVCPSVKMFFDKFSELFYKKLASAENIHQCAWVLLEMVLDFYAFSGDKKRLERFLKITFGFGFSEKACDCFVRNKTFIRDSWCLILRNCKGKIGYILGSISTFNVEELFFFIKAIEMLRTEKEFSHIYEEWASKDKIDLCRSVFSIAKPLIVEPLNIKLLEILLNEIIEESSESRDYAVKVFCSIIVSYFEQVEEFSSDVGSTIFTLLYNMLVKNIEKNGEEVLVTLLEVLRLVTPEECLDIILKCIEQACTPSLYSSLVPVTGWIIEEFCNHMNEKQLERMMQCLYTMCLSESDNISLRSIFMLHDVGECMMSRRIMWSTPNAFKKSTPSILGSVDNILLIKYWNILGKILDDRRSAMREAAATYLFASVETSVSGMCLREWSFASESCLIPLFEKSEMLIDLHDAGDIGTVILVLKEGNKFIAKIRYDEKFFCSFLDLLVHGLCKSTSHEIRNLCIEGLKIVTDRASKMGKIDSRKWKECAENEKHDINTDDSCTIESDICENGESTMFDEVVEKTALDENSSEKIKFRTSIKKEECFVIFTGFRKLLLEKYKCILQNFQVITHPEKVHFEFIEQLKRLSFADEELTLFIPFFRKFIHMNDFQEKVLELALNLEDRESSCNVLLDAYSDWINFIDVDLTKLLMQKMSGILSEGKGMKKYHVVTAKLMECSRYPILWEDALKAFTRCSERITARSAFNSFVGGSRTLLEESHRMTCSTTIREDSTTNRKIFGSISEEGGFSKENGAWKDIAGLVRKRERMLLEFLSFYHSVLLRFRNNLESIQDHILQPFELVTNNDIKEAYKVMLEISELNTRQRRENISVKCYAILFHDLCFLYDDIVVRVRSVLERYNEVEAIYSGLCSRQKQREAYTILDSICKCENIKLINDVKDLLIGLLKSKDYRVIGYVKRCLEILLISKVPS